MSRDSASYEAPAMMLSCGSLNAAMRVWLDDRRSPPSAGGSGCGRLRRRSIFYGRGRSRNSRSTTTSASA